MAILNNMKSSVQQTLTRFMHAVARYMQLQLFLTLVSLPIILLWGLPLSLLAPLGNFMFGPALTLFLFLSSLIFFGELLHIPTTPLIWALEKTTSLWLTLMPSNLQTWLVGFITPPLLLILIMCSAPFFIMLHKKLQPLWINLGVSCLLFLCITGYLKIIARTPQHEATQISCNRGALTLLQKNGVQTLIDPGYLGQSINAASFAQYTLMPTILKTTGSTTIDHLIVLQPGSMTFKALACLCAKMNIKTIYLVIWENKGKNAFLRNYFAWKKTVDTLGIQVVRISAYKATNIKLKNDECITIEPVGATLKSGDISFPALSVRTQIDNKVFTLYSAKYAKKQEKSSSKQQKMITVL